MTIYTTSHGTATPNPYAALKAKPRAVEATRGISHMGYAIPLERAARMPLT